MTDLEPLPWQGARYKARTNHERFWAQVDQSGDCWLWTGAPMPNGYGKFYLDGKIKYAHRIGYEAEWGPIPDGMVIDHKCHNRLCVHPDHLHAVSNSQNGQNRKGVQVNNKSGHRNVYWSAGKWRVQMRVNGRNVSGGAFDDLEEAAAVASRMRRELMTNSLGDMVA